MKLLLHSSVNAMDKITTWQIKAAVILLIDGCLISYFYLWDNAIKNYENEISKCRDFNP